MKRTKLADRQLPCYTRAEEITNTVTHIIGGAMSIVFLVLSVVFAAHHHNTYGIVSGAIYGASMLALYSVSSVYHGLPAGMAKKVMQVIDHCTIYFLIAGTYTVMALTALRPAYPMIGWGICIFEWIMALLAATLTAIDLKAYSVFSMICYIGMGWAILPFARQTYEAVTLPGFLLLLAGGIAYTVGSVLYGLGRKRKWMHAAFHVFVLIGSLLQFLTVILYVI